MKNLFLLGVTVLASTNVAASSSAPLPPISVQAPARYATGSDIPEKVRAECTELEKNTSQYLLEVLKAKKYAAPIAVDEINEASTGAGLRVEIVSINATPGGGWSGGKTMTIKAELLQDGVVIDSAVRSRSSKGGLFGAVKGNCGILENDAEALAADTYVWLVRRSNSKTLPTQLVATAAKTGSSDATTDADVTEDAAANDASGQVKAIANQQPLLIRTPATFAATAHIRQEILNECKLDTSLGNYAQEIFGQKVAGSSALMASTDTTGREVLELIILDASGDAGGSASGPKSMTVKAQLFRDGVLIDEYQNTRSGGKGGVFGNVFRGVCDTLQAVSRALAADSATWYLHRPKDAAKVETVSQDSTANASETLN